MLIFFDISLHLLDLIVIVRILLYLLDFGRLFRFVRHEDINQPVDGITEPFRLSR